MFEFELKDRVKLVHSDEVGTVVGRWECIDFDPRYDIRYKAADGRHVEAWRLRSALVLMTEADDQTVTDPHGPLNVVVGLEVTPPTVNATVTPVDTAEVDSEGMPYNPAYHAKNKGTNADGTWKALRGHADEAKAARDAFKAAGGADPEPVETLPAPPVAETPPVPNVVTPAPAPAPAAPPVATAPLPPSSMVEIPDTQAVIELLTKAITEGKLDAAQLGTFYGECGIQNTGAPTEEIDANETIRQNMSVKLNALYT